MNDPTNSKQVETVDHRAEAEHYLGCEAPTQLAGELANAHATLALVDEVAKLREAVGDCFGDDSNLDKLVCAIRYLERES